MNATEIETHSIQADLRTDAGHLVMIVECPISQQPEMIIRETAFGNGSCACGHLV